MFYYKIEKSKTEGGESVPGRHSHKGPRHSAKPPKDRPPAIANYMDKGRILQRQLSNCALKIGDDVKFKKKPFYGTLVDIEFDVTKVKWGQGGLQPNCMKVEVQKKDKKTGIIYGYDTVFTSPKNLVKAQKRRQPSAY